MTSTAVRSKPRRARALRAVIGLLVLAFWIGVWQLCAMAVGRAVVLPTPLAVAARFLALARTAGFWRALCGSLSRVTAGYLISSHSSVNPSLSGGLRWRISRTVRLKSPESSPCAAP